MTPASPEAGRSPDGVVYVATSRELSVTAGPGKSIAGVVDLLRAATFGMETRSLIGTGCFGRIRGGRSGEGDFCANINDDMGKTVGIVCGLPKFFPSRDVGVRGKLTGTRTRFRRELSFSGLPRSRRSRWTSGTTEKSPTRSLPATVWTTSIYSWPSKKFSTPLLPSPRRSPMAQKLDDGKFRVKSVVVTKAKVINGVIATKGKTAYLVDQAEGHILKLSHR